MKLPYAHVCKFTFAKIEESLFDVGKDLHGARVNHKYNQDEREILASYDSQVCDIHIFRREVK